MQAWGWVLEMYAFTISCYLEGVPPAALHIKMMGQPPWDEKLSDGFFLLHYTYGMDYDKMCCFSVLITCTIVCPAQKGRSCTLQAVSVEWLHSFIWL